MKIKEAEYKKVTREYNEIISEAVYGCDECKKPIGEEKMDISVFFNSGDTENNEFCSWKCVLAYLPKIKTDYFLTLPYLSYENNPEGMRASDFLDLITPPIK